MHLSKAFLISILKTNNNQHKIGIVSLGCAKNLVDTEVLMRQLDANNYQLVLDPADNDNIDTAIINTCGFILDAKKESIDTILRFVSARKSGKIRNLYVMGCLSERYKEQLKLEIPEVDDFFGVNDLKNIIQRIGGKFRNNLVGERKITTPSHYSYLKIAEGCDRKCSFCSIPFIRGNHISRPMEEIVKEARNLVKMGVREINIISQDTTYYGLDLYRKRKLPELLESLSAIKGLEWIRLHYTYPDGFPLELLEVIRDHDNICKYIDIPLQHINSGILKSMHRGIDKEGTISLIKKIRDTIPGIAIRTSLIVGYPGETQKEFLELKDFIRDSRFDRLGIFTYSHEEDTAAYRLQDKVTARIKEKRAGELMEIQQEISFELNEMKTGNLFNVIIDRIDGDYFIGRTEFDSPEIDNEVLIPLAGNPLSVGNFYNIKITSSDNFDLYGELSAG
jgi:ribosomal protein S12 methylthiotransferase